MQRDRESRARFFPVINMFNEVSSLLGSPLDIRRIEEPTREAPARHSWVRSSLLLMSSGDPTKLRTSLNILITEKDRAPRNSGSTTHPHPVEPIGSGSKISILSGPGPKISDTMNFS
jgi:hypothetical protein